MTPDNVEIWRGEFPLGKGDKIPEHVLKRANEYLTNVSLYKNEFEGILDYVFSWSDMARENTSTQSNFAIIATLPNFYIITESKVDLLAAKIPRIDAASDDKALNQKITETSSIVVNSNLHQTWQDVIRSAYSMFGNKIVRVSKLGDGGLKVVDMPLKCWIPFVNEEDTSTIEVNCFFNIYSVKQKNYIEFILYYETGKIQKYTFEYIGDGGNGALGEQVGEIEEDEAFNGAGVSPIVVFRGDCQGNGLFGESQYKYWSAAISNCIRSYEAIGILVERAKEVIRVLPEGAGRTNPDTDITYMEDSGRILYKGTEAPQVSIVMAAELKGAMDSAIEAYKQSLNRLCMDTGLPITYFDPRELGSTISGKSLKASMFRSELQATRVTSNFEYDLKRLIVKMALAENIEISINDFNIIIESGFVQDDEEANKIIQGRVGGLPTMSVADAIAALDGVPQAIANQRAAELQGIKIDDTTMNINVTTSGNENSIDGNISTTIGDLKDTNGNTREPIREAPLGIYQDS